MALVWAYLVHYIQGLSMEVFCVCTLYVKARLSAKNVKCEAWYRKFQHGIWMRPRVNI